MVCPSCNAECEKDGTCKDCGSSADDFGSEPTAVAPNSMAAATLAGQALRSMGVKTLDSSQAMSVDATLPGASSGRSSVDVGQLAVAAQTIPQHKEPSASDTSIGISASMIGHQLGSYRLLEVLGEGGMGRVYLAEHTKIGRRVALKMLHSHLARSPTVVRRFFDEARAVNRILHEHIVEITDFIENDGGDNYFIMEYLRGAPLSKVVERDQGSSTLARALSIGVQVASALAAVHAANIVHRDLKPENIFLTERGGQKDFVKLLDFGIAKLMSDDGSGLKLRSTEAGVIMGTPAFMSPEQASAKSVDHRTDIYALGVILYELCTGTLPFLADNFGDIVVMHKTQIPVRPSKVPGLMQEIPEPLDQLILHCLEKKPENRPQSAKEVEDRLHEIAWEFAVELENFDITSGFMGRPKGKGGGNMKYFAGLGVAAAAAAAFVLSSGSDSESKAAPPAEPSLVTAAPQTPEIDVAPTPPEVARVALLFSSEPLGAMVTEIGGTGVALGVTPFTILVEPNEDMRRFEFRKEGFGIATQEISGAEGGTVNAVLTAVRPPKVSKDKNRRSRKRKKETRSSGRKETVKQSYREGAVIDPFAN